MTPLNEDGPSRLHWLSLAVEQSPSAVMMTDLEGRIEYVNRKFTEMTGYTEGEVLGENPRMLQSGETSEEIYADLWTTITAGEVWEGEMKNRRKDGEPYWLHTRVTPLRGDDGEVSHYLALQEDVTERKQVEAELRESENRFRQFAENVKEAFWISDLREQELLYANQTFADIWGIPLEELAERQWAWYEAVHPDDRPDLEASMGKLLAGGSSIDVLRIIRPDGSVRWVRSRGFPVFDDAGEVQHVVGLSEDITEQRATERRLEQAQRMEAVGRLAGGIAHDFNNLLTVILAEAQLMEADLSPDTEVAESLRGIVNAGERASVLTRQLLAFSRRQLVDPEVFELNRLVVEMESMMRRIIGEDVRLVTSLAPDAGRVKADRGQLEQVLANLIVNSRDAMPRGGNLSIETSNVELDHAYAATRSEVSPGDYVKLSVSDTGVGMSEEVRQQAFDPFFTTKGPAKGTGLGLAMCHGIVKQNGGHIAIYSEPGLGTTVNVYMPRTRAEEDQLSSGEASAEVTGGNETILLVEDELSVRRVGRRVLSAKGYRVIEASDALEALELLSRHEDAIHLLFTDVVLPGMSGRELAERVEELRPSIRILFTSGYTDDVILKHRLLQDDYELLPKPFTADSLVRRVREVLDGPA